MKLCVYEAAFGRFPSVFVSDSEVRVQRAEQRALKAEEALHLALLKIQDLERKLQGQSSLSAEGTELPTPPASGSAPTLSTPTKKVPAEARAVSATKKTKKQWNQEAYYQTNKITK